MIEYGLKFAELKFKIYSERKLNVDEVLNPFCDYNIKEPDVEIYVSWDWKVVNLPDEKLLGEDPINVYYNINDMFYCITKGGYLGALSCTSYKKDLYKFRCFINEEPFLHPPKNLASILRMIPIKKIFVHYGVLFFHASLVSYKNRGILFAAPSGTGKTTQAKLWKKYRNAQIICNDRTLLRKFNGKWYCYGYPIDGSEPVRSSVVTELGVPVILAQSTKNETERLTIAQAGAGLMSQLVLDVWNADEHTEALQLLMELVEEFPVLLLNCSNDEEAVNVLENEYLQLGKQC